jgi:hypothetical protein
MLISLGLSAHRKRNRENKRKLKKNEDTYNRGGVNVCGTANPALKVDFTGLILFLPAMMIKKAVRTTNSALIF